MKRLGTILALIFLSAAALSAAQRVSVDVGERPFLGPPDAPVTVIEFLDFQ